MNLRNFIKTFSDERWNIGFVGNDLDGILKGEPLEVSWLKHDCRESWFADPFILDVTEDEIHILVEEFYKPIRRGRIARLIVNKHQYELTKKDVVLELPTHLSFPAILRTDKEVYIYPENGESGELNLYQYYSDTNKCVKRKRILNEAVADAVLFDVDGHKKLFCTKQPNPNGNVLCVYEKDLMGRFIQKEKYNFEEKIARMAGEMFEYDGIWYRPAQECNEQYGHAVILQKVLMENGICRFEEVRRMLSVHPKLNVGMHTFNSYKDVIVVDALGFDNIWLRKTMKLMKIYK